MRREPGDRLVAVVQILFELRTPDNVGIVSRFEVIMIDGECHKNMFEISIGIDLYRFKLLRIVVIDNH